MLKLTALGVGHGDATLLQWFQDGDPDKLGFTCLVDGGESPSRLLPALDRHGVTEINLLVLTHFDADHIGGLDGIWDHCKIHTCWAPCLAAFERHMSWRQQGSRCWWSFWWSRGWQGTALPFRQRTYIAVSRCFR